MTDELHLNDEEFEEIFEATSSRLRRYLCNLVDGNAIADEIAQEAFVRALTSLPPGLDRRQITAWLYRTASRLAADRWRRFEVESRWLRLTAPSVLAEMPDSDARSDLDRALARLPEKQRKLLWLAYVEEFSHDEISRITGVGVRSVRVLLHRARRTFADALRELDVALEQGERTQKNEQ